MAEQTRADGASAPRDADGKVPSRGGVAQWLAIYTLGRLAIAAALIGLLWVLGLSGAPGFLFGVLLAMPVSYLALARVREQLTGALVARNARKEKLRAELRGSDSEDG